MRVAIASAPGQHEPIGVAPSLVRDLPSRFPAAHLVPVALLRASRLDRHADPRGNTRIWLALESLQVTGSFKVRGALVALARAKEELGDDVRVVAASAGNHGAGVAYASKVLGVRSTIVVPQTAPLAKRARIEAAGAELLIAKGAHYDEAEAEAIDLARRVGAVFVSPYDDPFIAAGNGGSLGFEIAAALRRPPDVVVAPFGGGGLASGLAWSLREVGGHGEVKVWGVQTDASPSMAMSLARGAAVTTLTPEGETLAEGLEGGISVSGFARAAARIAGVVVVAESDVADAMRFAFRELGLVLEGSAAAALVPVLRALPEAVCPVRSADLVVTLTGHNVDPERLLRLG